MSYSEKAIERLIDKISGRNSCVYCVLRDECELVREITNETCKAEIKRILTEWSDEE